LHAGAGTQTVVINGEACVGISMSIAVAVKKPQKF